MTIAGRMMVCLAAGACAFAMDLRAAPTSIADGIVRSRVAGIDVIVKPTGVKDVVRIHGSIAAGSMFNPPDNAAIATLTAGMLDRGSVGRDKFEMAKRLEDVGATIGFLPTNTFVRVYARCLKKDMSMVVGLLAEQLRAPVFAPAELDKLREQEIGRIRELREDPTAYAWEAMRLSVYPPGHPNRIAPDQDQIEGARRARVEDLKRFHAQYYGPERMRLIAVGDIDVKAFQAAVEQGFSGWRSARAAPAQTWVSGAYVPAQREQTIVIPGKASATLYIAQATGLKYRDPDSLALRLATVVLGNGFTGRLMRNVRDQEGLTYGINAFMANDNIVDGDWRISATFAPELMERGLAATWRQLQEWHAHGITAKELAQRQQQMVGHYYVSLADTDGMAAAILNAVERGYDLGWLDEYPRAIQALTLEEVNRAIQIHLDPRKMVVIKAGTLPSDP